MQKTLYLFLGSEIYLLLIEKKKSILCWIVSYFTFSSHDSYLPILTMVDMPEIDISDVGMCNKMLASVCWNLMCFLCLCVGK